MERILFVKTYKGWRTDPMSKVGTDKTKSSDQRSNDLEERAMIREKRGLKKKQMHAEVQAIAYKGEK